MESICIVVQAFYDMDARVQRKAEALVAAGYSVDVLALRLPQGQKTYVRNGVNVHTLSLGKQRGSLLRYFFEYAAFFIWTLLRLTVLTKRRRYAVVDVNTLPDFLIFAAITARWQGAKLVLDMHEITPEFYMSKYGIAADSWVVKLLKFQERISFNFADRVVTISEPIQTLLEGRGLAPSKSIVVMNAADEARFARSRSQSEHVAPSRRADSVVFIYHGTLTKIYGLDIAVEAFASAHTQLPGAELWILGSGPEAPGLAAQAERLGVSSAVKLVGQVPSAEIPRWLDQSTVGILPIRRDVFLDFAFPNKLPEFIIAGKPVLVSRLNTIRHYFSDSAVEFFEPNDAADLARQMVRIYRDADRRNGLTKQAGIEYAAIRWDVMKDRYLALVGELIAGGAHRAQPARAAEPRALAR